MCLFVYQIPPIQNQISVSFLPMCCYFDAGKAKIKQNDFFFLISWKCWKEMKIFTHVSNKDKKEKKKKQIAMSMIPLYVFPYFKWVGTEIPF